MRTSCEQLAARHLLSDRLPLGPEEVPHLRRIRCLNKIVLLIPQRAEAVEHNSVLVCGRTLHLHG